MVCKESVVSWFGNLSSYKRIDAMCTLLNMCLPFEIRYLGTFIEDLGKRDYNVLRDTEHRANNSLDLSELSNICDKRTRRKLALYMSLLHSCNESCAVVLHKHLSNLDINEICNLTGTNDDQPLEELLLLYTMALNHPAFNYEQKSKFGTIFLKLQEEESKNTNPNAVKQNCIPCSNQKKEVSNFMVPPMPAFQARNIGAPGLGMTGFCIPEMSMNSMGAQYFPIFNHMQPWAAQVITNQIMYHPNEIVPYPSPVVSRQSSPSQSRSPSRSNSPMSRKSNILPRTSQVTQSTSTVTTSNTANSQSIAQLPSITTSRSSVRPVTSFLRQPPPRLKSTSRDQESIQEINSKDTSNLKNNSEILRLDEQEATIISQTYKMKLPNGQNTDKVDVSENKEVITDNTNENACSNKPSDQPSIQFYHGNAVGNVRRVPFPVIDPINMKYSLPPTMCSCMGCFMSGMQASYSSMTTHFQTRDEKSSSSDSTGSRSPPETPPVIPWNNSNDSSALSTSDNHRQSPNPSSIGPIHSSTDHQQLQSLHRTRNRKSNSHFIRHKSHNPINGGHQHHQPPAACYHPPGHTQMAYMPHAALTLRPSAGTGIYNFSPTLRPAYPYAYQPNGEMVYQFHHGHSGTSTPPSAGVSTSSSVSYVPTPVVQSTVLPPTSILSTKVSCYNCGNTNHTAVECNEQTMEDITKKAQFRLDYSVTKQSGECQNSDK